MVNIQINDKYRITSDKHQYSLEILKINKKKGTESWTAILFFGTIKSLLNYLPEYFARQEDSRTMKELAERIEYYHNLLRRGTAKQ